MSESKAFTVLFIYLFVVNLTLGSIVSDYGLDDQAIGFDPRQGQRIFPLSSVSRQVLEPTQPPVQWVPGVLSPGVKRGLGVTLTSHPYLELRSWMSRSYTSSPPKHLQGVERGCFALLYFFILRRSFNN
jgi:hypothetical protein